MKNIILGFPNRIDTATLSGGSWLASLPLNNIKNKRISKLARSTNALTTSTKFVISFPGAKQIDLFAAIGHNFSETATIRICGNSTNSFGSPLYDSGWQAVWPYGFTPLGQLEWEDDNFWLGTISEEALAGYITPYSFLIPGELAYQYWQIEINDTTNTDGYVQVGRLYFGPTFQPTFSYSYGSTLIVEDATTYESSLTGEEFFDLRQKYRVHTFTLDLLNKEEAYKTVLDMQRLVGTSGEIFIIADLDDIDNAPRRNFLGRMQQISPITEKNKKWYSTQFQIKEVL